MADHFRFLAVTWIFLNIIPSTTSQSFTTMFGGVHTCLSNGSALFGWTISADSATITYVKELVGAVMVVSNNVPNAIPPYDNPSDRAQYEGNATLRLNHLVKEDSGTYRCELSNGEKTTAELVVHTLDGCVLPTPVLLVDNKPVTPELKFLKDSSYTLSTTTPDNDPASVTVVYEVAYNGGDKEKLGIDSGCANFSSEVCSKPWVPTSAGEATIFATHSHPATESKMVQAQITVTDPPCASNPCQNSGTCTPVGRGYTCICPPNYSGVNCEIDDSPCASNPCQNSGTCTTDDGDSYNCNCTDNYNGVNCENKSKAGGLEWWAILLIVLAVLAVIGLIIGLLYCYKQCCFAEK